MHLKECQEREKALQQRLEEAERARVTAQAHFVALEQDQANTIKALRQQVTDTERKREEEGKAFARRLAEAEARQLAARADEARRYAQDTTQLLRWISQLDRCFASVINSSRWRLGHALALLYRKIRFKSPLPLPQEHWAELLQEIEIWKKAAETHQAKQLPSAPREAPSTPPATSQSSFPLTATRNERGSHKLRPLDNLLPLLRSQVALSRRWGIFRYLHVEHALRSVPNPLRVLSVGCGNGWAEVLLAATFPAITFRCVDIHPSFHEAKQLAAKLHLTNISFAVDDLFRMSGGDYHFTFSIEVLEHIEDAHAAARHLMATLCPGGYLFMLVPFATPAEQQNLVSKRNNWEQHQHYVVGYNEQNLREFFPGYVVKFCHGVYWRQSAMPVRELMQALSDGVLRANYEHFYSLAKLDFRSQVPTSRKEALGIKLLIQAPAAAPVATLANFALQENPQVHKRTSANKELTATGETTTTALREKLLENERALIIAQEQLYTLEQRRATEKKALQQQLLEVERLLTVRTSEVRQYAQDRAQVSRWIGLLDRCFASVINSSRWRLGHALAALYRKIRFKSPLPLPQEHWAGIMQELEAWKQVEKNHTGGRSPHARTSLRESESNSDVVLKEAVAEAERTLRIECWPEVVKSWQAVLAGCGKNEGLAARAKLNIHMARRLSDPHACREQIAAYVAARANKKTQSSADKQIVIYTAIAGGFDVVKLPEKPDPRFDYVLFADTPMPETGVYQVRPLTYVHHDSVRSARFVKTHPHMLLAGYEIAIWIDANLLILGELAPFVEEFLASGKPVGAIPHPFRKSIYEELDACMRLKADEVETMKEQIAHYRQRGFDCNDLIESNLMMFNLQDERLRPFLDTWWKEIDRFSRRDQLSLNYALQQANLEWHPLMKSPLSTRTHPAFAYMAHDRGTGIAQKLLAALRIPVVDPYAGPSYADVREQRVAAQQHRRIDIVVCVHNALDDVKSCLESIRRTRSSEQQRLILVDDGSDEATARYLEEFATNAAWVERHRNPQAQGYTKAANQGLALSRGELVILLNSDTIVTDRWAEKMADAVFSTPGVGIVGPLSNAASHQSIPDHRSAKDQTAINELPPGLTPADMNRYCEQWTVAHVLPRVPLIHGFCFGIAREVIDTIGGFDERHFPKGYGEENDYCCRAVDAGFSLVVATHTYVFHAKSKSYAGVERVDLIKAGAEALRQLHGRPRIERAIRSMQQNPLLNKFRQLALTLRCLGREDAGDE